MDAIERVLFAARDLVVRDGFVAVSRGNVARAAGLSTTHITRVVQKTKVSIRDEVLRRAIANHDLPVLARAVAAGLTVPTADAIAARMAYPDLADPLAVAAKQRRARPAIGTSHVMSTAIQMVRDRGFGLSREQIAEEAGVCPASVSNAFGTYRRMPDALLRWAVEQSDAKLIARGLQIDHPAAKAAPIELRREAAKILIES